jgi:uncharacterized protein (TIGR02118 family)
MIKVSVLYPNSDGAKFDMDYYLNNHMRMVREKLGAACRNIGVDQGISGTQPGEKAAFIAMGHLFFDSADAFRNAFGPHASAIVADIPNYTNVQPTIVISEVKMWR